MRSIESFDPSYDLRKYVRAYAERKLVVSGQPVIAPVPARLEQTMEFQFGDSFKVGFDDGSWLSTPRITVVGPQTWTRGQAEFQGQIHSFTVFFQPSGFSQIFDVPMKDLVNKAVDATSILSQRIRAVWNKLGEADSIGNRAGIIERFLRETLPHKQCHHRMMDTSNRLLMLRGRIGIAELARQEGMGLRHFERRFNEHVGVGPKLHARIARFQTALDMKVASPQKTWLEISHALEYHDQMHLIHDFKSLGGNSPGRVLEHLCGMRPDVLAASSLDATE